MTFFERNFAVSFLPEPGRACLVPAYGGGMGLRLSDRWMPSRPGTVWLCGRDAADKGWPERDGPAKIQEKGGQSF